MRLFWAFFVRDFQTETSYRIAFLLNFTGVFVTSFLYFFISQLFGNSVNQLLAEYNGDYFAFVIIGVAFGGYFGVGLNGFAQALRQAQTTGTLEAMMMTPTSVSGIILGSALWSYAFTTFRVFIYLLLGTLFLGLQLNSANYLGALVCLIISIITFASVGIIAASVIMVIKRGDPVTGLFNAFAILVGGVYYPVHVLPDWLQAISRFLPITYSLHAVRLALLNGATWPELMPDLTILLGFSIVLFPLSLFTFRYAVERARKDGSLAHY